MKPEKIIGVLGGMGPAATANFFTDIVALSQKLYRAEQDTEFPRVYLYNAPLEGFNETGFDNPALVKEQLVADVQKLESWGADFIVMPCNTVHFFVKEMQEAISIPILSIIDAAIAEVKKNNFTRVGILSSTSTRALGLYENALHQEGCTTFLATDEEQKKLDAIILAVMAGKQSEQEKNWMLSMINRMSAEGAEVVILGCTELPLAIRASDTQVPLVNTIYTLAESAVKESYTKK